MQSGCSPSVFSGPFSLTAKRMQLNQRKGARHARRLFSGNDSRILEKLDPQSPMLSPRLRIRPVLAFVLLSIIVISLTAWLIPAQAAPPPAKLEPSFEQYVKPFFQQNCIKCHSSDVGT